jgi:hypothetical protein
MLCAEGRRTLICYAGSASEASIGSKPIGSELTSLICIVCRKSQDSVDLNGNLCLRPMQPEDIQGIDIQAIFQHCDTSATGVGIAE